MTTDRALIEAALAAGKARRIPAGVGVGHPDWAAYAAPGDPLETLLGVRVFAAFQHSPSTAMSAKDVEKWLSRRSLAATSTSQIDRHARIVGAIRLLAHHGLVAEAPAAKGKAERWRLKRTDLPKPNLTALKEESRRLAWGNERQNKDKKP